MCIRDSLGTGVWVLRGHRPRRRIPHPVRALRENHRQGGTEGGPGAAYRLCGQHRQQPGVSPAFRSAGQRLVHQPGALSEEKIRKRKARVFDAGLPFSFVRIYSKSGGLRGADADRIPSKAFFWGIGRPGVKPANVAVWTPYQAVSYTHLDVYKRQPWTWPAFCGLVCRKTRLFQGFRPYFVTTKEGWSCRL